MKTSELEIHIAQYFKCFSRNIVIPNVGKGFDIHECDLLVLTRKNYLYEVELKVDRWDLQRDANKNHHHYDPRIKGLWFAVPDTIQDAREYIPNKAGLLTVNPKGVVTEKNKPWLNAGARKVSDEEKIKLLRLGCMRVWSLKKKHLDIDR